MSLQSLGAVHSIIERSYIRRGCPVFAWPCLAGLFEKSPPASLFSHDSFFLPICVATCYDCSRSEWEGSGLEATGEQQAEIPPVVAEETASGAVEGAKVKTTYAVRSARRLQSIRRQEERAEALAALGLEENASITTTDATASIRTTTTTSTTASEADPVKFNFNEPPILLENEPILVEGATTDGTIAGTESFPINGGVVLDIAARNTGEGNIGLRSALNEPPIIHAAGSRIIGPFDCRGMTGFSCCLVIKHFVRDSDLNSRSVQCHLDYDSTTCKKKWWLATETSKKVLIYANHNEMVNRDPMISGSWPQCDATWGETRDWGKAWGENTISCHFLTHVPFLPIAHPPYFIRLVLSICVQQRKSAAARTTAMPSARTGSAAPHSGTAGTGSRGATSAASPEPAGPRATSMASVCGTGAAPITAARSATAPTAALPTGSADRARNGARGTRDASRSAGTKRHPCSSKSSARRKPMSALPWT